MKRVLKKMTNDSGQLICEHCQIADRFVDRLIGLMGRSNLSVNQGMFFPNSNSVHMWFMKIELDLVFLRDAQSPSTYEVVSFRENVKPWSLLPFSDLKSQHTLELCAGKVKLSNLQKGDLLCLD
jgi:uncharacterized membrane protein (UPF0127 family)